MVVRVDIAGQRCERAVRHADGQRRRVLEGVRHREQKDPHRRGPDYAASVQAVRRSSQDYAEPRTTNHEREPGPRNARTRNAVAQVTVLRCRKGSDRPWHGAACGSASRSAPAGSRGRGGAIESRPQSRRRSPCRRRAGGAPGRGRRRAESQHCVEQIGGASGNGGAEMSGRRSPSSRCR